MKIRLTTERVIPENEVDLYFEHLRRLGIRVPKNIRKTKSFVQQNTVPGHDVKTLYEILED